MWNWLIKIRHRIKLRHPFLHCVVEKFPEGQEDRFYPLELCKLLDNEGKSMLPIWLGRTFTEIRSADKTTEGISDDDDSDMLTISSGRDKCSQDESTSYW